MAGLRITLKHALARRHGRVMARAKRFEILLDTQNAVDVGQVLSLRKRMMRGVWEHCFVQACFEHIKPDDIVFEVGTWIGPYSVILGKYILLNGRIIGFEPDPVAFRQCITNLELNRVSNVSVLPIAISNTCGIVRLYTNRIFGNSGSSLVTGNPTAKGYKKTQIDVPSVTLDRISNTLKIWPTVIKMDIEGAEYLAIEGGTETLSRAGVRLFLEVHDEYLRIQGKSSREVLTRLADLGKKLYFLEDDPAFPYHFMERMDPGRDIDVPNYHILAY